jgi:Concanavalin A-like lectin/glucanases superfamily
MFSGIDFLGNSSVRLAQQQTLQTYGNNLTGSATFSNTGQSHTIGLTTTTTTAIGTSPFTIEFWIWPTQSDTDQGIFGTRSTTNSSGRHYCILNSSGRSGWARVTFVNNPSGGSLNTTNSIMSGTFNYNRWNHVAITRDSSNVCRIFINGLLSSETQTWNTNFADNQYVIGRQSTDITTSNGLVYSSIACFSISNICVYNSAFTPVRKEIITDSSKILLLNFSSSSNLLVDSRGLNTITNSGVIFSNNNPNVSEQTLVIRWDWRGTNGAQLAKTVNVVDKSGLGSASRSLVANTPSSSAFSIESLTTVTNTSLQKFNNWSYFRSGTGNTGYYRSNNTIFPMYTLPNGGSYSVSFWYRPSTIAGLSESRVYQLLTSTPIRMFRNGNWSSSSFTNTEGTSIPNNNATTYVANASGRTFTISNNAWCHVVVTCNVSTGLLNVYVNNIQVVTNVTTTGFFSSNQMFGDPIQLLVNSSSNGNIGYMTDFRLYNSELPASFITLLFNGDL